MTEAGDAGADDGVASAAPAEAELGSADRSSGVRRRAQALFGVAGAVLLCVAAATVALSDGRDHQVGVAVAGGEPSGMESSTTSTLSADEVVDASTTTPPTTGATSTIAGSSTTRRPPVGFTRPTVRPDGGEGSSSTTRWVPPWKVSPLEPGTEEWGSGGYGASRDVESGRTRMKWGVYLRDQYEGDELQTTAEIYDDGLVVDVVIDFGDGAQWRPFGGGNFGHTCQGVRPVPIYYQGERHVYAKPGDYPVRVTVTTRLCGSDEASGRAGTENVITATLTTHVHEGPRPRAS